MILMAWLVLPLCIVTGGHTAWASMDMMTDQADTQTAAETALNGFFNNLNGNFDVTPKFGLTKDDLIAATPQFVFTKTKSGTQVTQTGDFILYFNLMDEPGEQGNYTFAQYILAGINSGNCLLFLKAEAIGNTQDVNMVFADANGTVIYNNEHTFAGRSSSVRPGAPLTDPIKQTIGAALQVNSLRLDVPVICQKPEGKSACEITSWTMMAQYAGAAIDKLSAISEMPRNGSDPNQGFVGDPYSWYGYTIYPPALKNMTVKYCGSFVNLTGCGLTGLVAHLIEGAPVVVWVNQMIPGMKNHAICLIGFDGEGFFYNDPWTGTSGHISYTEFYRVWDTDFKSSYGVAELAMSYLPTTALVARK